jgi:hypothetical protein
MSGMCVQSIPNRLGGGWSLSSPLVTIQWTHHTSWIRLGRTGPGLLLLDRRDWVPFSIRNHYQRSWSIGRFIVAGLRRN